ncbi:MAG TPA: hypothetical protein VFW33_00930, partial [Gemmataceae bacterium]|nr:hypothetical protein [Gemmataceae bacterium]
ANLERRDTLFREDNQPAGGKTAGTSQEATQQMTRKVLGIVALVAALGLVSAALAGANNGNGNGNGNATTKTNNGNGNANGQSKSDTQATTTAPASSNKPAGGGNGGGTKTAPDGTPTVNNGGGNPSCGNSCDTSHNPTGVNKPCRPVPGNGCHRLPQTPCGRGHNGVRAHNKHCGPAEAPIKVVKEQKLLGQADSAFTTSVINAPLNQSDLVYRITVTSSSTKAYTLNATDPNCSGKAASGLSPSGPQTLAANGTVVYNCNIDVIPGIGNPVAIPTNATPGGGPYTYPNTVTVVATPAGGGTALTLTSTVTASVN